jgi:uncharacterized GH25 family protein
MTEGAVVLGRVTWNGKPLPGVSVGIVSTDRSMEHFTGNFEVGTDTYGRFAFVNLPPHVQYNLYGIMQSFLNYGAVMSSQVSTEGDGSRVDAGELVVGPAHRLAGRVVLDDGKPIPPETRLLVGREDAWDTLQIVLDQDGHFDTAGVPSGAVSLSVQVPGYRVSAKNASLDTLNPFGLSGRVDQDITNLVLLMEKGPNLEPNYESPAMNARQGQPLRGAENANDHSNQIAISGHVVDAETKRPIARFRVTPGHARRFAGEPDRLSQRTVDGANGAFTVYIDGTTFDPLLKAEADGYLPAASPTLMPNRTNYDFALTRGTGPRGTVLLPNGQPAEGVSVLLVCAGEDYTDYYTGLDEDGRLTGYQNQSLKMQTDASGRFSFAPELQMESVIFSGPRGLTWVSVESLAGGPGTVVLNPWGKIKGKLQRTSGPSKGEDLETKAVPPPGVPEHAFSLGGQAVTDADGNFEFDRVPAGVSKLSCRVKTRRQPMAGSQNVTLQQVTVKPGETLELTIHAPDRLPEVSQRLKQYAPQAEKPAKSGPLLRAVVLLPDGTPVAGADVACVSSNVILIIQEHSLQGGLRAARIIQTAKDGSFTLDTDDATTDIVAVHQKGFAKVSPEKVRASGKIDLQPWGRIEGVLHIGSRLGTNEVVGLTRTGFGARYITLAGEGLNFRARTDSQGRFLIRDVPPIEQSIGRLVSPGQGFTSVTNILVKAGEPTWVEIGGTGRPVLGQLVLDEAGKQVDWTTAGCTLRSKLPPFPKFKTMQEQGAWWTSESGPKWRFYSMLAKADGSFRIEDVPPGPYDLMITIRQETPGRRTSRAMKTIASGQKEVTVAESQGPADDSPVDLGTIPVKVHHPLGIGDMAAPIDAQTLDGLPLRLADYRGTNVLLIFGVPPSNSGEIDQLKEIASACAGDKRLAMINISLHWDPDLAKDAFKRSDLNCIRGFVSTEKSNRDIFEKYADTSPIINNFICLIDPDGKIIGKDMIGAEIEDSVAKALAKK